MNSDKLQFLQNEFIFLLKHLAPDAKGNWGKMNGQQMVEHFTDFVKIANGKLSLPPINTGEKLEKYRRFMLSDQPFKENTRNPLLPEIPPETRHQTIQDAIAELQAEINYFAAIFQNEPGKTTENPLFGSLDFDENIHLLYKHAQHHLKQFGMQSMGTAG